MLIQICVKNSCADLHDCWGWAKAPDRIDLHPLVKTNDRG
jgi:hypothetical protein